LRIGSLKKMLLKLYHILTDFGPIHMLKMDSNTLCTADIEQRQLATVQVVWVVAAGFVLRTVRCEFLKNI